MMPRLHVGDVAVSRPLGSQLPPLTSVLLFDDPDHPGRLRMHRLVRVDDDGLLVTRGDANGADDSTPVPLAAVRGIGTLRVPWVALPIVWLREGRWLAAGAGRGRARRCCSWSRPSGRDRVFADDEPPDDPDGPTGPGAPGAAGGHARLGRVDPVPGSLHGPSPPAAPGPWCRAVALLGRGASLVGRLPHPRQRAVRATTTTSRRRSAAATRFTCANAVASLRARPLVPDGRDLVHDDHGDRQLGRTAGPASTARPARRPRRPKACPHDTRPGDDLQRLQRLPQLAGRAGRACRTPSACAIWFRTTTTTRRQADRLRQPAQTGQPRATTTGTST